MNGIAKMQITHLTEQQVEKTNVPRLLQTIKAIAPRSYEKAFSGIDEKVITFAMSKAVDGLTKAQIEIGLNSMFKQGFCPDPVMFRKWCLGINGFSSDVDPIHASYRNRNAALANIEAWVCNDTTPITNAEREAYNRCYTMFNDLKFNYSDKQKFHTYEAFKGFYDEVVKNLVENGVSQCDWIKPVEIERKRYILKSLNYLDDVTPEQLAESEATKSKIEKLISEGMSLPMATMQVLKEGRK